MLDMRQRQAVTKELKAIYNKAAKKENLKYFDEFTALAGYNRCYASCILKIRKEKVLGYIILGQKTCPFISEALEKLEHFSFSFIFW